MKKNYILFFLLSWIGFYGQTYNFNLTTGIQCNICQEEGAPPGGPTYNQFTATNYYYLIKYNNTTIATENTNYVSYTNSVPRYTVAIPNGSLFTVTMTSNGSVHYDITSGPCNTTDPPKTITLQNLIINGVVGFQNYPCGLSANINSFTPNITIKNVDVSNPNTICAGATLALNAFSTNDSGRFPDEAYHWQYSLDNTSWTDFPASIVNNKPDPIFSIQQLLGASHGNYFNKLIYFRIGYLNRAFSNVLSIKYSPCAPIITAIDYIGPQCYGDKIQKVEVTFDRPLNSGESLDRIKMKNVLSGLERNERIDITPLGTINPKVYSFSNLDDLEPGQTYKIVYQAKIANVVDPTNPILMGFMDSPPSTDFTYITPAQMQFKITKQNQPTCFGGTDGSIEVEILSGANPYNFYIDNVLQPASEITQIDASHYRINGLKENLTGYKIKVTDKNDCIEKL
jgi:hypothetical protein